MRFLSFLFALFLLLLVAAIILGLYRTFKTERSENQEKFVLGTADIDSLDGDFRGKVRGYNGTWQGKTFSRAESSGINRFQGQGVLTPKYPFKTYVAKGLRDKAVDVVVLDYNQSGNPWWLKFIVDEVVSNAPNAYLGKIHIRLAPRIVFSIGYFTLEKI